MAFKADGELDFSAYEAERVISSFKEEGARKAFDGQTAESVKRMRAALAKELSGYYKFGNQERGVTPDSYKAAQYKKIALSYDETSDPEIVVNEAALLKTANAYETLGWFTSLRLFGLRMHRIMKLGKISSVTFSLFTSYGGLSYIVELAVDCGVILKAILAPSKNEKKENPSWRSRAWHTFRKGERPARMANAAVWFGVNLACLFITGGASAILNVVLFAFDVGVDIYKWARDHIKDLRLVKKLKSKIAALDKEINEEYKNNPEYNIWREQDETKWLQKLRESIQNSKDEITKLETEACESNKVRRTEITLRIEALRKVVDKEQKQLDKIEQKITERNKYLCLKAQVAYQKKKNNRLRIYLFIITTVIFVGMAFVFFPPAPAALIAGSIAAFLGSIFAGLGRRLFLRYEKWRDKKSVEHVVDKEIELETPPRFDSAPVRRMSSTATVDLLCHPDAKSEPVAEIESPIELAALPSPAKSENLVSVVTTPTGIGREPLSPTTPLSSSAPLSPVKLRITASASDQSQSELKQRRLNTNTSNTSNTSSAALSAFDEVDTASSASESPSPRTTPPSSSDESSADLSDDTRLPRCAGGQVVETLRRRMSSPPSLANLSLLHSPTSKSKPKFEVKMVKPVKLTDGRDGPQPNQRAQTPIPMSLRSAVAR